MKNSRLYSVPILVLLVLMLAACSQPGGIELPAEGGAVAALVNQHRISKGLQPLEWSHDVYLFAQVHADDMAFQGGVFPTNSDGEDFAERIAASGIVYITYGENLASGFPSADTVMAGWIASTPHLANIENPAFTKQGVGYNPGDDYWCQVFIGD